MGPRSSGRFIAVAKSETNEESSISSERNDPGREAIIPFVRAPVFAAVATLVFASTALGVPPALLSVGENSRRPTATFTAAGAAGVTLYVSSSPDRATNGRFFDENVKDISFLTDSEIQTGRWLSDGKIDPGRYWVMLNAYNACFLPSGEADPACADGFSQPLPLTVPKPKTRYSVSAKKDRFLKSMDLRVVAKPLGDRLAYRLCYPTKRVKRKCLSGALRGYDWDSSTQSTLSVSTSGLKPTTTFTWQVNGKKVASLRVRVR